jgi:hypothetical protein
MLGRSAQNQQGVDAFGVFVVSDFVMAANSIESVSLKQLRHAVLLKERIAALEAELAGTLSRRVTRLKTARGRYKRSAATRARMAAAQRSRWSKRKGEIIQRVRKAAQELNARVRKRIAAATREM